MGGKYTLCSSWKRNRGCSSRLLYIKNVLYSRKKRYKGINIDDDEDDVIDDGDDKFALKRKREKNTAKQFRV